MGGNCMFLSLFYKRDNVCVCVGGYQQEVLQPERTGSRCILKTEITET